MPFLKPLANPTSNRSLLRQVLGGMSVVLLILAILGGSYGFWNSFREISHFQDDNLKNIARLIADNNFATLDKLQRYQTADNDGGLSVDVLPTSPRLPKNSVNATAQAIDDKTLNAIPLGLSAQTLAGETWQVYRLDKGNSSILVRQRMDLQKDLAETSAFQSILPLVLAIVTLGLLMSYIIWQMFRPVQQLAKTVSTRQDFDLSPLPLADLPKEVVPFVMAINQLLTQVKINVAQQQRFIADASHELRSPLTAISLQLQRLQRLASEPKLQEGLDKLAIRVQRNQDLVEQLLTLARLNAHSDSLEPVPIRPLIEQVVNLLLPIIDHKAISLRVQIAPMVENLAIHADGTAILLMIKNLVQNAVLYTPENGEVNIRLHTLADCSASVLTGLSSSQAIVMPTLISLNLVSPNLAPLGDLPADTPMLQIIDTGCGIDPADYQQAFEPFVRLTSETTATSMSTPLATPIQSIPSATLRSDSSPHSSSHSSFNGINTENNTKNNTATSVKGTGLGLSIVKTVCEQANIGLFLSPSPPFDNPFKNANRGLCVTLVFPTNAL